jgi:putative MATE family efflux protein
MYKLIFSDKEFYRRLIKLAAPITVQQLIIVSVGMVDVMMIGQLGETSVAAVGLADQVTFLLFLMLFGISSGAAIFTAQFWGQQDIIRIRSVLGICLLLSLAGGLLFALLAVLAPRWVLSIYSTDPAVVTLGANYLQVVGLGYFALAITISYSSVLRSIESVKLPLMASIIAFSFNVVMNYALIFGHFGLPKMGVMGAAIATCAARYLEGLIVVGVVYSRKMPVAARLSEMLNLKVISLRQFLKTTVPVMLTEITWSLGITTYNVIYARIGTESIAAVNIAVTIDRVLFVVFIGLAFACATMLGNRIGAGEIEKATTYAKRFLALGPLIAITLGITLLISVDAVLPLYKVSALTIKFAHNLLMIMAFTLTIRVSNLLLLIGILRSGGDTRFAFFIDAGVVWLVGVPLAFTGAFILQWPVYLVYLLVMTEEVVKLGLGAWRFSSQRWIHRLTATA